MSAHFGAGQQGDGTAELADGPGRRLRVARQALGLDLDHVADTLHLRRSMVESLEHDDYESLPAKVYVIGYIRKYARLVGLDPEPLLASYPAAAPRTEPPGYQGAPRRAARIGSGRLLVRLIGTGILVLLAALAYLWWQGQGPVTGTAASDSGTGQRGGAATLSRSPEETLAAPAVDSDLNVAPIAPRIPEPETRAQVSPVVPTAPPDTHLRQAAADVPTTVEADGESAGGGQTEVSDPGPATSDPAALVPEHAEDNAEQGSDTAGAEIVMSFDGPCWVDVRDNKREYKLFGEMNKGDRHVLEGEPPYSFILGNAAAVRITVGGKAFDLSTKSRGNVARFTLDPRDLP